MVEIIPAIMPQSLEVLAQSTSRVSGLVHTVQIDVMDGVFVPEVSWPYVKGGSQEFQTLLDADEGLPLWETTSYEVDLMVTDPETVVLKWVDIGVGRIIVHFESTKHLRGIINNLETRTSRDSLTHAPVEFGVALSIDTPLESIEPFVHDIDFVQCMGIARIGYQGETLDERVIERIKRLRRLHPHLIISVDGGVTHENAPTLVAAGATRLVSGSTIFKSSNIRHTIESLRTL